MPTCVQFPLDQLREQPFSLANASPRHLRFVDCHGLVDEGVVRALDFETLPDQPYTTISYVWSGLKSDYDKGSEVSISVQGADTADPIGANVLKSACVAAIKLECKLMWLDRLCIMQDTPEDKRWQIQQVYDIYKASKVCIVLVGGMSRLGTLFEETSWIYRAWTLQEAMAPADTRYLFSWERVTRTFQRNAPVIITEVEEQRSAMTTLVSLLQATLRRFDFRFDKEEAAARMEAGTPTNEPTNWLKPRLLADYNSPTGHNAMKGLESGLFEKEGRVAAIWRSVYLRTSSRAVGMVFSIMGLPGVSLDPNDFAENDRHAAIVALLRELMRRGDRRFCLE